MNSLRKTISFVMVLTLAAFALPSTAANPNVSKYFTATESPHILSSPGGPVSGVDLKVRFTNTTPPGPASNSAINSLILTLPAGTNLQINSITVSSGSYTLVPPTTIGPSSGPVPGPLQIKVNGIAGGGLHVGDPAFVVTVNVSTASCTSFTWDAQAFAGNSWGGDVFVASSNSLGVGCGFTGQVSCGGTIQTGDPAGNGSRGLFNKFGACTTGESLTYTFINNGTVDDSVVLSFPPESGATFFFTVTGSPEDVDSTGWPVNHRPSLSWKLDANLQPLPNTKVSAVACLSSNLPAPYGTLGTPLNASTAGTTVANVSITTATGVTLPATPFPIVIDSERLKVTLTSGSSGTVSMTVVRGDGLTAGTAVPSHLGNATVMSTPLPIDPNPKLADGVTANQFFQHVDLMCIAKRGWTSYDIDPATGVQRVRWWSLVFDIGDGWYGD